MFKHGVDIDAVPRRDTFCSHMIEQFEVMVVPDLLEDTRFVDNPFVSGDPNIRFYAGSPLTSHDGYNLGSLCVLDQQPKELNPTQQLMLKSLSKQAIQLLEFDTSIQVLKEQYAEAKRAEIELRSFFESSIDCHMLLGKNFEVLAFNKAWQTFVNVTYNKSLQRGEPMTTYLHPENIKLFYQDYIKALKGTATFVQRKIKHGQNDAWRIFKFEPAFDGEGIIIGVSVNSTDITNKVTQEETVAAQNKSLRAIAYIQSHELRRPVASILGLMNLLKTDGHTEKIEELKLMDVAVNELDEKIRSIVDYTSII